MIGVPAFFFLVLWTRRTLSTYINRSWMACSRTCGQSGKTYTRNKCIGLGGALAIWMATTTTTTTTHRAIIWLVYGLLVGPFGVGRTPDLIYDSKGTTCGVRNPLEDLDAPASAAFSSSTPACLWFLSRIWPRFCSLSLPPSLSTRSMLWSLSLSTSSLWP